jgi:hypothetical protein
VPEPIAIEMETVIEAPPSVVWGYLVDWERLDRWMTEATNFRVVSPQREGLGVVAEATIRIGFIKTTDRIRVTGWNPPHLLRLEHLGWVKGEGLMEPLPHSEATFLRWLELLKPPWGIVGAIGLRLWKPIMRRRFVRDLRLLKIWVESEFKG